MLFLQVFINSFVTSVQVLLLAAALYLIYMVSNIFHIAIAAIMLVSAYMFYALNQIPVPFIYAFFIAIFSSALIGMVSYLLLQDFAEKKMQLPGLLVSIGLWLCLESIIAMIFGSDGKFLVDNVLKTFSFKSLYITQVGFWTLITGLLIVVVSYVFIQYLPTGRIIRAVKQHSHCASIIGIKEKRVQLFVYFLSSLITGIVGLLIGLNNAITPTSGTPLTIIAFIALLVGGVNNFKGVIIATFILVIIPELLISMNISGININSSWKMFIIFILALSVLMVRPNGILSYKIRKT